MSFFSQELITSTQKNEGFKYPQIPKYSRSQGLKRSKQPSQDLNKTRPHNNKPHNVTTTMPKLSNSQASRSQVVNPSKYTRPAWATAGSGDKQKLQRLINQSNHSHIQRIFDKFLMYKFLEIRSRISLAVQFFSNFM